MRAGAALGALAAIGAIAALSPAGSLAIAPSPPPLISAATTTAAATAASPAPAQARASLPAIERRVMCVTCKIPLIVAESPQADRERAFIRGLIAEGKTASQIERALVGQYGPTALGLPSARGFDLAAYLAPLVAVGALAGTLALLLPRWRKRSRRASEHPAAPTISTAERARLDADLARFDR